jgi:hypothetical protein
MAAIRELELEDDLQDETGSDYDGFFQEEDFAAMGIDPQVPTPAKPGSEDKVLVLAARYAAGLPLWHDRDCYDHGPGLALLEGGDDEMEDELDA